MEYKFKEYERVMDTPNKKLEEKAIVERIMLILNEKKKYNSIDDFYESNQTIDAFKKNNNMDVVLKHFGEKLNQDDYVKIINSLKKLTEKKSDFDKDGIKTTNIEDKEYVTYKGNDEDFYLNNSYTDKNIEDQMHDLQQENVDFQTSDIKENTNRLMKELRKNKKLELTLRYLNEINYEVLNNEQQELFKYVFEYQKNINDLVRLDLDEKVLVDSNDNIIKIEKIDGQFKTINGNEKYSDDNLNTNNIEKKEEKENVLSFKKMPKTQLFSGKE